MKKLIREPLVHFLLIGAALFGVYFALNKDKPASQEDITITSGQIENLAVGFTKVWHRPPTRTELKDLIDDQVKEEVLSREAVKLGLDQNDTVIRRRLRQKMEFIAEDFVAAREPSSAELADYLAKHPDQFAQEQRFTFRQVFLSKDERGHPLDADFTALLAQLKEHPTSDTSELGDTLLLPQEFAREPQRGVAAQFGKTFAAALTKLSIGEWSGPVESGYGVHLVLVTERTEGRAPALAEVRDQVKQRLINERRREANQQFLEGLVAKYRVTIEEVSRGPAPGETAMNR